METFHLYHLAACWGPRKSALKPAEPPLTTNSVSPTVHQEVTSNQTVSPQVLAGHDTVIKAAAAQLVFASRTSQAFITPEQVSALEAWSAKGVLEALKNTPIEANRLHQEEGSVWEHHAN
ncbi:hypothetical protein ONZ45_g17015 [Pleurotus djamor]|nr:hypothetical protein ONZ45_g17015 [Pleurotus djamor]